MSEMADLVRLLEQCQTVSEETGERAIDIFTRSIELQKQQKEEERKGQIKENLEEVETLLGDLEGFDRRISPLELPDPLVVQQTVVRHLVYIYKELLGESAHV